MHKRHAVRERRPFGLAVTAAVVAAQAFSVSAAGAASPAALHCGDVITRSVTLHTDLLNCSGHGLVVGADQVTVNLNGHHVSGDGVPGSETPDAGILVVGRSHVSVTNGVLTSFDRGVRLENSASDYVTDVTIAHMTRSGVSIAGTTASMVRHVRSHDNLQGVAINAESSGNLVSALTAYQNEAGVLVDGNHNRVADGNLFNNADGLIVTGSENRIVHNVITNAVGCGDDCGGMGISLEAGQGNAVVRNVVLRSLSDDIRVGSFIPTSPTRDSLIRDNVVLHAGRDGISVGTDTASPTSDTVVKGNVMAGSSGDGLHVVDSRTVIARNLAVANHLHGIEAVPGVVDGGRNRAAGNATPPQCIAVVCKP